jgi:hypothetical protein
MIIPIAMPPNKYPGGFHQSDAELSSRPDFNNELYGLPVYIIDKLNVYSYQHPGVSPTDERLRSSASAESVPVGFSILQVA